MKYFMRGLCKILNIKKIKQFFFLKQTILEILWEEGFNCSFKNTQGGKSDSKMGGKWAGLTPLINQVCQNSNPSTNQSSLAYLLSQSELISVLAFLKNRIVVTRFFDIFIVVQKRRYIFVIHKPVFKNIYTTQQAYYTVHFLFCL